MDYTPSRFIQKTLLPDEHCIKDARFPLMYTLQAWILGGLCPVFGYALHDVLWRFMGHYTLTLIYVGIATGLLMFSSMMVEKWSTEIILTNARVIYKRGFLLMKVVEVDIEQLASDNIHQSLLGRLLDYGEVRIRCIEADDINLPAIRKPYEFRNAIEQQKHAYREQYMKFDHLRRHGEETLKN